MTLAKIVKTLMGLFGCQRYQFTKESCYNMPGSPALCAMCWLYQAKGVPHQETEATMRKNMQTYYEKNR